MDILKTLRQEVEKSGKTRYVIWQETGVTQEQLHRLMKGKALTVKTTEILLRYFGYQLTKGKQGKK